MDFPKVAFEPMNEVHQREIEILEKLLNKLNENKEFKKEFEEFFEDVKKHFAFEEELMQKFNFFAYLPHKMEHDKIIQELKEIKNKDKEEVLKYFNERFLPWLDNHILTIDTVTAGFLNMQKETK